MSKGAFISVVFIVGYFVFQMHKSDIKKQNLKKSIQPVSITKVVNDAKILENKNTIEKEKVLEKKNKEIQTKRNLWKANKFVDEFGDFTDKKYIMQDYKSGYYSDFLRNKSKLEGKLIISKKQIWFNSYELDREYQKEEYQKTKKSEIFFVRIGTEGYIPNSNSPRFFYTDGILYLKNLNGKKISLPITKKLTIPYGKHYKELITFLQSSHGEIQMALYNNKKDRSQIFKINANGFNWNYKNNL